MWFELHVYWSSFIGFIHILACCWIDPFISRKCPYLSLPSFLVLKQGLGVLILLTVKNMSITSGWPLVSVFPVSGSPLIWVSLRDIVLQITNALSIVFPVFFSLFQLVSFCYHVYRFTDLVFGCLQSAVKSISEGFIYGISAWLFFLVSILLLRFLYLFIPYFPLNSWTYL